MLIKNLVLKNYRNYDDLFVEFNDKLNIFIGNNAQGKTNILESIYVLAVTKSYLGVGDKDLIKFNRDFFDIKAKIFGNGSSKKLEIKLLNNKKKVFINDKEIRKFRDYVSNLNVIIFSPDNIRMIKDGPSVRRKFLNVEISQILNRYVLLMNDFNCILHQRNEVLKQQGNINKIYLEIINDKFISLAVDICIERKKFIDLINEKIVGIFKDITTIDGLNLKYNCSFKLDEDRKISISNLKTKIDEAFERECRYGNSLYGPHKDDFSFFIDDKDLAIFGSQGQMRSAILALKLSEIGVFKEYTDDYPILLLDDIFSELDVMKRNNLIKYISENVQTIITTTDLNMINDVLVKDANIFEIDDGKIIGNNGK